ncbi:MAG: DUF2087 domain-containing protein [Pseudomonadota bacterium]
MSRQPIPLLADDISTFTRSLARQLRAAADMPGHLSLMNMVARASGFRNFQHLKAAHSAGRRLATPTRPEVVDHKLVERALHQFDAIGRLKKWPSRQSVQDLCLWALWARFPKGICLQEPEVNALLNAGHLFEDPAILRRSLVTQGLMTRNRDGSDYRRVKGRPTANARALISHLEQRRAV